MYYHKGKDILNKADLFLWILELCRLLLVLTIFFAGTKFQLEGQAEVLGTILGL